MPRKTTKVYLDQYLTIKGTLFTRTLSRMTRGQHAKDTRECYRWSIHYPMVKDTEETIHILKQCFEDRLDDQYCPKWIKDAINEESLQEVEYINFKSQYPLIVKDMEGKELNPDDILSGATGYFKLKLKADKEGTYTAYCSRFIMTENGKNNDLASCDF